METIVRYPARQGNFSATQKLLDVTIPADSGVVDLSESYVAVRVSANITDGSAATAEDGVFSIATHLGARDGSGADDAKKEFLQAPVASVLVKNGSLMSSKKGKISEIRNVACLRSTLALLSKDQAELQDSKNLNGAPRGDQVNPVGNLCELNQLLEKSSQRANEIRIMLKDIFNFCKEDAYDTSAMGALQIHLELHLDKLQCFNTMSVANFGKNVNEDANNEIYSVMVNQAFGAGAFGTTTPLQTRHAYDSLEDAPYYNQMKVTISHSTAGGAQPDVVRQIVSVVHDQATKRVLLTLDDNVAAGAVTTTALNVVPVEPNAVAVVYDKIDLVANYISGSGSDAIQYTEYVTLEDTFTPAKVFQRNYHLQPNCVNVLITFPSEIYSIVDQTLGNDNILSYRISVDNRELTNRRIEMNGPVHHDLLQKTFANQGVPLKNLVGKVRVINFPISDDQNSKIPLMAIACPIPNAGDGNQKMLTIDLEAQDTIPTAGAGDFQLGGKINIYQEVVKQI